MSSTVTVVLDGQVWQIGWDAFFEGGDEPWIPLDSNEIGGYVLGEGEILFQGEEGYKFHTLLECIPGVQMSWFKPVEKEEL